MIQRMLRHRSITKFGIGCAVLNLQGSLQAHPLTCPLFKLLYTVSVSNSAHLFEHHVAYSMFVFSVLPDYLFVRWFAILHTQSTSDYRAALSYRDRFALLSLSDKLFLTLYLCYYFHMAHKSVAQERNSSVR